MTIKEWRQLKPGDKVWVNPDYFAFPFIGVIKMKNGRKVVWINIYGAAQFVWDRDDRNSTLRDLAVYREGEQAKTAFLICRGRVCCGCQYIREAENGQPWCKRHDHMVDAELGSCMFWTKRNFKKLTRIKHIKHE